MRSRYSAFVQLDEDYLLRTHHPSTAPAGLDLDPAMEWRRWFYVDGDILA